MRSDMDSRKEMVSSVDKYPVVSVVMATYNGAKFLQQQLESIEAQSRKPDELVIVDDCSTDKTWSMLQQFANGKNWVKLFRNDANQGVMGTFSKALINSVGDLVFVSDQDDIWFDNKIEKMLSFWKGQALIFSNANIVDESGVKILDSEIDLHGCEIVSGSNPYYFFFFFFFSGHNMSVSRVLINLALPADVVIMFDNWFALVASLVDAVVYVPEVLCSHRMHSANAMNNPEVRKSKRKIREKKSKRQRFIGKHLSFMKTLQTVQRYSGVNAEFDSLVNQLIDHHLNFDARLANVNLCVRLYQQKNVIFPRKNWLLQLKAIRNACLGVRGYWLAI